MTGSKRRCVGLLAVVLSICLIPSFASATEITLSTSPATPIEGAWSAGDLVEVVITAESDGASDQGFSGADFKSDTWAISVLDTTKLKVNDVLLQHPEQGDTQIDTESDAGLWNGLYGYSKPDDTWVYDEFTDFEGDVVMSDGAFEAVVGQPATSGDPSLGTGGTPVDVLHLVLEVQSGFAVGETTGVQFSGQVAAYNTAEVDTTSDIFGSTGGAINSGSFELTNVPEPATAAVLLAGLAGLLRRRRTS